MSATIKKSVMGSALPGTETTARMTVHIGGFRAYNGPVILDTVLGSCIATCLYDPVVNVGGMNHFMLPHAIDPRDPTSARYGVNAMELLISELTQLGAIHMRLEAKIFGGGHVLNLRESLDGIPQRNIAFVRKFLATEQIPIVNEDVGGYNPRRVLFYTHSGKVLLKYLGRIDAEQKSQEELAYLIKLEEEKYDGEVELF